MPSPSTRRRGRKAPIVTLEADIALPKEGVGVVLPPAAPAEAEHIPAPVKPKLPPGTRRAPTLEQLKQRAAKANKASKARVDITVRVDVPLYKALVELAEEYNVSMSDVARQCLADGARKYRDFNSPYNASPFRPTTPMRANPEIVESIGRDRPQTGAFSPSEVRARSGALLAEDLTGPIPEYDETVDARTQSGLDRLAMEAAMRLGGSFLPQSATKLSPTGDGTLAFDPLAPVADEADPGLAHADSLTADV